MRGFKSKNMRMKAVPENFSFIDKYNLVYFENVCKAQITSNPTDLSKCQAVSESSLQYGIQSFVYYFTDDALEYLNDTDTLTFDTLYRY